MVCTSWAHTKVRCNMVWRHTKGGPSIGFPEQEGSGVCGQLHYRLLHGSKLAYASANVVAGASIGNKGYRPDWFLGRPMTSLLTRGTAVPVFKIMEAPLVSMEGRKTKSIVIVDPGSNMNLITRELAYQLQVEGAQTMIFIKRVNEEFTEREVTVYRLGVEDAKKQVHRMEAVGVGSITELVPLQNKDELRQDFPDIREEAVKRPAGAAGLLISMTERQLHSQGGIEKGKLPLSRTPLGCGEVLTGVALRGEKSQEGE